MRYTPRQANTGDQLGSGDQISLFETLEPVVRGLGLAIVELALSRHKSSVQVRLVVCKAGGGNVGVDDCSRAHRALLPRLELVFPGQDMYVEVGSPGIDRVIKDGSEFVYYLGRGIKCYRTDISDWTGGILESADEKGVVLKGKDGMTEIVYELIAKAKLDYTLDYLREV
ncbi:conserved hypothetical protein [Treponema primitia ZAS-2]|uniref:Ribosome maturation factor RimP n=1 Tax=Treponema primitia (strain ATCC BAA-887 / DSM 12427 / ZAS-2) TaxID=545694 RepID=F5YM33_TREPZ|nr:ribosome assembly cofactor RimP [Treponema primitia]AEF85626.1 conserved hypothetical protein [Treponema primitia ZAS-2]